jgi:hypothetical protein
MQFYNEGQAAAPGGLGPGVSQPAGWALRIPLSPMGCRAPPRRDGAADGSGERSSRAGQLPRTHVVHIGAWRAPVLPQDADTGAEGGGRVLFSSCKGETHTPKQGFKQLFRRLRSMFRPEKLESKDDLTLENLRTAAVVVFGCPRDKFNTNEFNVLKRYVQQGGSLLIMLQEGGEARTGTNINFLLEEFGMSVNSDSVVRTTHYKYLHPKEVRAPAHAGRDDGCVCMCVWHAHGWA